MKAFLNDILLNYNREGDKNGNSEKFGNVFYRWGES
jgi:hypothetical protein